MADYTRSCEHGEQTEEAIDEAKQTERADEPSASREASPSPAAEDKPELAAEETKAIKGDSTQADIEKVEDGKEIKRDSTQADIEKVGDGKEIKRRDAKQADVKKVNDGKEIKRKVDIYGFERPEDFDYATYDDFMAKYLSVLARRGSRWQGYMGSSNSKALKKSSQLKRYIRKGIPTEHRAMVWMHVSGAEAHRQQNPGLYKSLLADKHEKELVDVIKTDIHRTFPDNIYFQAESPLDPLGKRVPLYNVLLAVGHKNKRIGYCQGLNFIAGLLLLIVKDEEKVFWLLDTLINEILPEYYAPDMMGIKVDQEALTEIVKMKLPDVHRFLESAGASFALISTKWFICLFADVVPTETLLRIWDCLFYEGTKILFRVAFILVKKNREKILSCQNFPQIMDVFKHCTSDATVTNCHQFMESVFKDTGSFSQSLVDRQRKDAHDKIVAEG